MDHIGTFSLVLHSHIPYCRRSGVWPFGEEWVFEAVVETYIPILDWLLNCHEKGIGPNVTLSFSPVLAEQLADAYMKSRIVEYMDARANAARADLMRHESVHDDRLARLSRKYVEYYENAKKRFIDYYDGDLLGAIAKLAASGRVEVLATSASHAYLPRLSAIAASRITYSHSDSRRLRGMPTALWRFAQGRMASRMRIQAWRNRARAGGMWNRVFHSRYPSNSWRWPAKPVWWRS